MGRPGQESGPPSRGGVHVGAPGVGGRAWLCSFLLVSRALEWPLGARQWTVVACSQSLPAARWDAGGGFNWPRVDQGEVLGVHSPQGAVDLPDLHSLAVRLSPPTRGLREGTVLACVSLKGRPAPCSPRAVS